MRRSPGPWATREEIAEWNAYLDRQARISDRIALIVMVLAFVGAALTAIFR